MATANAEYLRPDDAEEIEDSPLDDKSGITAIEEADRSHMIRTAQQNPRSITKFIKELTEIACFDQHTAMEMMYSIPRDGKQLIGPSIGFAEAALAVWGNARAGSEIIEVNAHEGFVVAEGRYYDCEKNVGRAIRKRRRVVAKRITGDALQVTGDAASSIATREAILRSIPKPLWKPVWEKAKETALGKAMSVDKARTTLVEIFKKMGVTELQMLNTLQVAGIDDIGGDEIIALQAWKKQLNEKVSTIEDIFGSPLDAEIAKMLDESGRTPPQQANIRGKYAGKSKEFHDFLKEEKAKNSQVTMAPKTTKAKVEPIKAEPQAAQEQPEPEQGESREEFERDRMGQTGEDNARKTAPKPTPAPAAQQEPLPPAAEYDNW